jgi:Tfp pilus assembly protein PilZ
MHEDKRSSQRRRTLKAARLVFGNLDRVFDCTIRNLSEGGVMVKVDNNHLIPDEILLYIDGDSIRRPARVAWRGDKEIGLEFTGPAETLGRR